jgi:hypothetical protein
MALPVPLRHGHNAGGDRQSHVPVRKLEPQRRRGQAEPCPRPEAGATTPEGTGRAMSPSGSSH